MKDLFEMDLKDYNPDGKVYSRPSVRAIIYDEDKVLLVHSRKYDYYNFPGGGIEEGEDHKAALIREVKEETGFDVIESSIEEFGRVPRKQKDSFDEDGIFFQENFYYFCKIEGKQSELKLVGYEEEEGYEPVWVNAMLASRHNLYKQLDVPAIDEGMIKRDGKVLDIADLAIRKRIRYEQETEYIRKLGDLDYKDMLDFVEKELSETCSEYIGAKKDISYSRFSHTKRVLSWAKRLYDLSEVKEKLNYEDVMIATIFHDVGRNAAIKNDEPHAIAGIPITRNYLLSKGFEEKRVEYICSLVGSHSDKDRLYSEKDLDPNLVLLMEADLLDDMGALGVVMDCMIVMTRNPGAVFEDCYDHIMRFTNRIQKENPMVTKAGIRMWDEKTKLVNEFVSHLKADIEF